MCSLEEFEETYRQFHNIYDEFKTRLDLALDQESINDEMALNSYKNSIELIDKTMLIPISFPTDENLSEDVILKIKDLKKIIFNFKMQRSEILLRMGTLLYQDTKKLKMSDSTEGNMKLRTRTYNELEDVLKNLGKLKRDHSSTNTIIEILFSCENVKLYYIESNGEVVSNVIDFVLRIIRLGSDFEKNLDETIFLQLIKTSETSIEVGKEMDENHSEPSTSTDPPQENVEDVDPSFIYPLIPGVSPLFRTHFNAFIMPDLQSNDGSAIGMIVPSDYDDLVLDILVSILKGIVKENGEIEFGDFTKLNEENDRVKRSAADKVSAGIVNSAYWISSGLVKTAQATGSLIDYSTPYILSRVQSVDDQPPISNKIQTSVTVAKSLSGYAAQGTTFLAEKVGGAMNSFGRYLAPHVQRQGSKFLIYTTGIDESKAETTMTETLKIASGTAEAISTIYSGLETSASILGRNIADNSVTVIRHKYGETYGNTANSTFDTVGNLIAVNKSFNILTPKGLVKSSAKGAGKGILSADEFKPNSYLNKDYFTGSVSLYPNLENLAKEMNTK